MLRYKCQKCKRVFETSLSSGSCLSLKCQSRQITDITPTHKGVKYRNFEWTLADEGEKDYRKRDKQGRKIRQQIYQSFLEEIKRCQVD